MDAPAKRQFVIAFQGVEGPLPPYLIRDSGAPVFFGCEDAALGAVPALCGVWWVGGAEPLWTAPATVRVTGSKQVTWSGPIGGAEHNM